MEQLHSLSALDDEGLLTRLGRRVRREREREREIVTFILSCTDGRVSFGASTIKNANSVRSSWM